MTALPVGEFPDKPEKAPFLEYEFHAFAEGEAELTLLLSPTLAYNANEGLRLAIQLDDGPLRVVNVHEKYTRKQQWREVVADNVRRVQAKLDLSGGGHRLRVYQLDNGIVLQRLLIDCGGLKPSYLAPPTSPSAGEGN